jgi:hypothetical protein
MAGGTACRAKGEVGRASSPHFGHELSSAVKTGMVVHE